MPKQALARLQPRGWDVKHCPPARCCSGHPSPRPSPGSTPRPSLRAPLTPHRGAALTPLPESNSGAGGSPRRHRPCTSAHSQLPGFSFRVSHRHPGARRDAAPARRAGPGSPRQWPLPHTRKGCSRPVRRGLPLPPRDLVSGSGKSGQEGEVRGGEHTLTSNAGPRSSHRLWVQPVSGQGASVRQGRPGGPGVPGEK